MSFQPATAHSRLLAYPFSPSLPGTSRIALHIIVHSPSKLDLALLSPPLTATRPPADGILHQALNGPRACELVRRLHHTFLIANRHGLIDGLLGRRHIQGGSAGQRVSGLADYTASLTRQDSSQDAPGFAESAEGVMDQAQASQGDTGDGPLASPNQKLNRAQKCVTRPESKEDWDNFIIA